jgi:hypothetical protein
VYGIVSAARVDRNGRPALGVELILAQDPFEPVAIDETPPPKAHASNAAVLAKYLADRAAFLNDYRAASAATRSRRREERFPVYGFPPAPPFQTGGQ